MIMISLFGMIMIFPGPPWNSINERACKVALLPFPSPPVLPSGLFVVTLEFHHMSFPKKRGTHEGQGAQGRAREGVPRGSWGPLALPWVPWPSWVPLFFRKT